MTRDEILAKELTQGAVPLGIPAAYKFDIGMAEASAAKAADAIRKIDSEGQIYVDRAAAQATAAATSAEAAAKIVDVGVDPTLTVSGAAADAKVVGDRLVRDEAIVNTNIARIDSVNNRQDYELGIIDTKLATSVEMKDTYLHAENGDYITDEDGNRILSQLYLPVTDSTLKETGVPADAAAVGRTFNSQYEQYPIPILYLYDDGSMAQLVSKQSGTLKNSVRYNFPRFGIMGTLAKVKVQGASSQGYPKKNYTLTFEKKFDAGWGYHDKYVIKANWIDFSHARNVVCAKLWGDVRKTAIKSDDLVTDQTGNYITDQNGNKILTEADPMLSVGLNMGAIDGFPIAVVINNVYWGLYSFNIPKDGWMAKMEFGEREAIVSAETHSIPTRFKALAAVDSDGNLTEQDFSMEYCKNEDNQSWIATSLNRMIQAVMNSTGANYEATCGMYIDIDSAIDYFIFNCLINNTDGTDKNYLLDTFDGVKWYFAAYDMDGVLGNLYHGYSYYRADGDCTFALFQNTNRMMHLIYTYDTARLCARYRELRRGPLGEDSVTYRLMNYCVNIPKANHDYEVLRWLGIPGTDTNNITQILNWYRLRCIALDAEITALESAL